MKGLSFILFPHIIPQTIYPGIDLHLTYPQEALEQLKELKVTLIGTETFNGRQTSLVNEIIEYRDGFIIRGGGAPKSEGEAEASSNSPVPPVSSRTFSTTTPPILSSSTPPSTTPASTTCNDECPYANFRQFPCTCLVIPMSAGLPPTCFLPEGSVTYILKIEGESIKGKHEPQCLPLVCVSWKMEKNCLSGRYSGMTRSTIERQPGSANLHIECLLDKSSYCFDDTIAVMFHVNNTTSEPITKICFSLVQRLSLDRATEKRKTAIQEYTFDNDLPAAPGSVYKQPFQIKLPELSSELPPSVRSSTFRVEYLLEAQVKFSQEGLTSPIARTLLLILTCEGLMTEIPDRIVNSLIRTTMAATSTKKKGLLASLRGLVGSD